MRIHAAVGLAAVALGVYLAATDRSQDPAPSGSSVPPSALAPVDSKPAGGSPAGSRGRCRLRESEGVTEAVATGCRILFDDGSAEDPRGIWGEVDCETESRHQLLPSDGDPAPRADGPPQPAEGFRRLTVFDGDDVYGERCELGDNHHQGPTALYHEGERRLTFISLRLPTQLPLDGNVFQVLMQMKQTQPADNGGGTPVLALEAWRGRWRLRQSDSVGYSEEAREIWSAPARTGAWTRFALDITYSQDPEVGRITVFADLNGDGDLADDGEESETIETYTLKAETAGDDDDGLGEGDSIPSHLRAGVYHNPEYECPSPLGCAVDIDNVQVLAP